eukprot:8893322-Pyramimonas_sp.AAC.1
MTEEAAKGTIQEVVAEAWGRDRRGEAKADSRWSAMGGAPNAERGAATRRAAPRALTRAPLAQGGR